MENALKNIDHLDPWVQKTLPPFCKELLRLFPRRISSICLYGSAAAGEHIRKHSDINLMIIFDTFQIEDLQKCFKLVKRGRKQGITPPLIFTPEHICTSTDVFPIEFLEMKEKHITLFGEDPFTDLQIDPGNLRLQCEQQIKGKVIRLRQAYLGTGLHRHRLWGLLTSSFTSLLPVLRNIIRLIHPSAIPPRSNQEIILQICKDFDLDNEVFLDILKIKKGFVKPDTGMTQCIFEAYLNNLSELARRIDQIDCPRIEDPGVH